MTSFDLRHEPWIPVLTRDHQTRRVGLLEVFAEAKQILAIATELPTQQFALTRLLLAIMHAAADGPQTLTEWRNIRSDWDGFQTAIADYLDEYRDHFDLFHPQVPFMQVPNLRTAKGEVTGLERLIMDVPSGEQYFTTRAGAGLERVSFGDAALWLVNVQAYDVSGIKSGAVGDPRVKGGKGYPIGTGWAGQLSGIQARGEDLFETLMLNLVVPSPGDELSQDYDRDAPYWEMREENRGSDQEQQARADNPEDFTQNYSRGLLDLYTWQSRRVRLNLSTEGDYVDGVLICNGDKILPQNQYRQEPQSVWRYSKPQTDKFKSKGVGPIYMPAMADLSKASWRGIASILGEEVRSGKDTVRSIKPAVVAFTGQLVVEGDIKRRVQNYITVSVVYGSNESVVDGVAADGLDLSVALLPPNESSRKLRELAVTGISRLDELRFFLGIFAKTLAEIAGDKNAADAASRAEETYYSEVDSIYRKWLRSLTEENSYDVQLEQLNQELMALCRRLSEELLNLAPPRVQIGQPDPANPERWRSGVDAQGRFIYQVRKILGYTAEKGSEVTQ